MIQTYFWIIMTFPLPPSILKRASWDWSTCKMDLFRNNFCFFLFKYQKCSTENIFHTHIWLHKQFLTSWLIEAFSSVDMSVLTYVYLDTPPQFSCCSPTLISCRERPKHCVALALFGNTENLLFLFTCVRLYKHCTSCLSTLIWLFLTAYACFSLCSMMCL